MDPEKFITAGWGYSIWLAGAVTNTNGVAILFSHDLEHNVHNIIREFGGCFICMGVAFVKKRITLVYVHWPSNGAKLEVVVILVVKYRKLEMGR